MQDIFPFFPIQFSVQGDIHMYFDTHAHFDSEKFEGDRLEVLASMPAAGVELILDPGSDLATSRSALALAEQFDFVYAAAGVDDVPISVLSS